MIIFKILYILFKKYSYLLFIVSNKYLIDELRYFIAKDYLFQTWIEKSLTKLEQSSHVKSSEGDFKDLFNDINLAWSKLGNSEAVKNKSIGFVLMQLSEINFEYDVDEIDVLGDAYEDWIANFASQVCEKAGEFYTPQEVLKILVLIVTTNKKDLKNAYDPACGSGSLLLQISKLANVGVLYGQEIKDTTSNLARMNMFLRRKNYHDFDVKLEDTIMDPQHLVDENDNVIKFDAIVANPPSSMNWDSQGHLLSDPRFNGYGRLAPKLKMDYAFIQNMLYRLDINGTMTTVASRGVLFRGTAEGEIRKYILDKNWLDTIIGLPTNIFYGTSIPSCIIVFKKNRKPSQSILFIEASREFEKVNAEIAQVEKEIEEMIKKLVEVKLDDLIFKFYK